MDNKAFYLGHKGLKIRAMLEDELDFVYNEQKGESIDIKEFMKNKLRNISVPKYMIVEVKALHTAEPNLLIDLRNSVAEINEGFKYMIVLLNDEIDKNISDNMKSHARNGKNYVVIEESNEEKLIEKLKTKIIELENDEFQKENITVVEDKISINKKRANENVIKEDTKNQDIRAREIIKTDTLTAKDMKRQIASEENPREEVKTASKNQVNKILEKNDKIKIVKAVMKEDNIIDMPEKILKTEQPFPDTNSGSDFKTFKPNLEVEENFLDLLYPVKKESENRNWEIPGQNILVIGCDKRVGATFIALALAQSLAKEKAYAMYCLVSSDSIALSDKANDYNLIRKNDNYYSYNEVPFTRILTDKNANFIVYDIDMQLAKRSFSNKKIAKTILVSDGNTQGLRKLEDKIAELKTAGIDTYDIVMVNTIFDKDIYKSFENQKVNVHYWEHCVKATDKEAINQECFTKIIDELYDLELEHRNNEHVIEEFIKDDIEVSAEAEI